MANSIFPDVDSAGGELFRIADGTCLLPLPDIHNADCPPTTYKSTCDLSALPSNCDARIEPRQINAIVSELLNFAACVDPQGTWNCNSLRNLCAAFTAWANLNISGVIVADEPPVGAADNQLWWESDTGFLFINYRDANSLQWVQITSRIVVDKVSIVGAGTAGDPHAVGLVDCGVW